jgi:2-hydroxy-3-keto-5-methylthiopentenyl-1-phosphate phosphatase
LCCAGIECQLQGDFKAAKEIGAGAEKLTDGLKAQVEKMAPELKDFINCVTTKAVSSCTVPRMDQLLSVMSKPFQKEIEAVKKELELIPGFKEKAEAKRETCINAK